MLVYQMFIYTLLWACCMGLQNTLTVSLQKGKTIPNECPGYDINNLMVRLQ